VDCLWVNALLRRLPTCSPSHVVFRDRATEQTFEHAHCTLHCMPQRVTRQVHFEPCEAKTCFCEASLSYGASANESVGNGGRGSESTIEASRYQALIAAFQNVSTTFKLCTAYVPNPFPYVAAGGFAGGAMASQVKPDAG
jgi:hypothetical protein